MTVNSKISINMNRQNSNHDKFSHVTLCGTCTGKSCCTDFAEPILFPTDLVKLDGIKKSSPDFIQEIVIKDKHIKTIKRKKDSNSCIFFNQETNRCDIYQDRPFDCRMYPFDILWVDNGYHWIIYSCNPNSDWSWTEEHIKRIEDDPQFREVMKNREVFRLMSENHIGKTIKPAYVILRRVGC